MLPFELDETTAAAACAVFGCKPSSELTEALAEALVAVLEDKQLAACQTIQMLCLNINTKRVEGTVDALIRRGVTAKLLALVNVEGRADLAAAACRALHNVVLSKEGQAAAVADGAIE